MPGVPPDAVDNVKKLLKGIFKRGKNKKQDRPAETAAPTPPQTTTPNTATTADAPQQAQDLNKPLPPTQPLATGQHDEPQEAIPINHDAQAGPLAGTQDEVKQADNQAVSNTAPAPGGAPEPVPAVENSTAPVPAKTAGAADTPNLDTTATEETAAPVTAAPPAATPAIAPLQANGTTDSIKAAEVPSTNTATVPTTEVGTQEEKVVEPTPAVPNASSAPGMSATSGPLEDYPDAGGAEQKK